MARSSWFVYAPWWQWRVFFKGAQVRAVWCEFYDTDKQRWSKARLLLATETDLRAEEILQFSY